MTAPRITERKGAVWSDVIVRASAPFASRSHKEDSFDTERWHNRLFRPLLARTYAREKRQQLDVEHVLREGQVIREPEWDVDCWNWKYHVEGTDIEGDELTAITVIFEQDFSVLVVTVF